ncbi:MAG: hypothetical protein MUP71_05090 [Candidatus Aminicenantes bacterium]|nr:hypothetical protein [Candidatus Aminicenantes bacterium]
MNINRIKIVGILALMFMVFLPAVAFAEWKIYYTGHCAKMFGSAGRGSFGTKAQCEAYRANSAERNCSHCAGSDGSDTAFQGTPEQQMVQGLVGGLLNFIFAKPDTSRQDEINRQNALKRQQEKEQKEAARIAGNQAWIDLQNIEQEKRTFDDKKKLAAGEDLLSTMETVGGGELELKTIETDFFQGDAMVVDLTGLKGEQGIVGSLKTSEEQAEFEKSPAAWKKKQGELIQQRLQEPNKWCSAIYRSLKTNAPPPPDKQWNELQPGDVLLLKGKAIAYVDNKFSSGDNASSAAHTVIFLKEVNGKKYFLDSQPAPFNRGKGGPRIIDEDEYMKVYGQRGTEVARLVGAPLNPKETKLLFEAAVEKAQKNRQAIAKNWFGSPWLGTNFGAWGKDALVCSEADWALINATGRSIPKSGDQLKVMLGIDFSPADYLNSKYFLVTRMSIIPGSSAEKE